MAEAPARTRNILERRGLARLNKRKRAPPMTQPSRTKAMRSGNGPPFASDAGRKIVAAPVWWLKLGIQLERIEPGKPQQNGRLERCHPTLEEAVSPEAEDLVTQRRAIDEWRREYNEVRPHEVLGDVPPAVVYRRSPRGYPRRS